MVLLWQVINLVGVTVDDASFDCNVHQAKEGADYSFQNSL